MVGKEKRPFEALPHPTHVTQDFTPKGASIE